MKRGQPLQRKTPLAPSAPPARKSPMRRKSRKRSTPARKSAREQDCTLCFPGCPNNRETVVLCHLRMFSGGGVGLKPSDLESVFGDDYCHSRLDGRVPWLRESINVWEYIARALVRTHRVLHAAGIITLKGETA
jgi:hypothetical protein